MQNLYAKVSYSLTFLLALLNFNQTHAEVFLPLSCEGDATHPWYLSLHSAQGALQIAQAPLLKLDFQHSTTTENAKFHRLLTMKGHEEEFFIILNEALCETKFAKNFPIEIFLIPKNQQPLTVLQGCCTVAE